MNDTTLRLTERAARGVTAVMALARSTAWGLTSFTP
jgi:hypothetical protein